LGECSLQIMYAVVLAEKRVTHYEAQDIAYLIELGIIEPHAFIYSYPFKKWVKANSLKEIRMLLNEIILARIPTGKEKIPEFIPPPPPMSAYYSLRETIKRSGAMYEESILEKKEVENINLNLQKQVSELSAKKEELLNDVKNWQDQYCAIKFQEKNQQSIDVNYQQELEDLQNSYESLKTVQSEDENLLKTNELHLKEALLENKKLAKAIVKLSRDKSKLVTYTSDLETQLNQALKSREGLKKNLKKREVDLVKLKKRENQARKLIRNLGTEKNTFDAQREVDLNRLIGESFEVSNEPKWFIKRDGQSKGPYRFSDVLEWIDKGYLERKTLIRKQSEKTFTRLEKIYEFNTKIFTKMDKVENTLKKRFFIKRTDFRAPFYEVVKLEYNNHSFKAHCTSLSVGGCFIELKDFPENLEKNSVLNCVIQTDYLSQSIEVQMIVKNFSKEKPLGIGCQFLDLNNEEKETIEEFVETYLNSKEKAA
jgi:hypothetical protein